MKYLMKKIILFSAFIFSFHVAHGQLAMNLELSESTAGGCAENSDCGNNRICFDLFATPSEDGSVLLSYGLWYVLNGGGTENIVMSYLSDSSCMIVDNSDLPENGATTFIRVGASDGDQNSIINGRTLIHSFCLTYTALETLPGATIEAGGEFSGFKSSMSMDLSGIPIDIIPIPAVVSLGSSNVSCLVAAPVEFASFNVEKVDHRKAKLIWKTFTEIENDYFEIQRKLGNGKFGKVTQIKGAGTTSIPQVYDFVDELSPDVEIAFYRIKTVDFDEGIDYSDVKAVRFKRSASLQVYPNPITEAVKIFIPDIDKREKVTLELYSINGVKLAIKEARVNKMGHYELNLNTFNPGTYILNIHHKDWSAQEKIIKIN
jgi:hypothetical protein